MTKSITAALNIEDLRKLAKRRGSPSLADRREAGGNDREEGLLLAEQLRLHRFPAGISLGNP